MQDNLVDPAVGKATKRLLPFLAIMLIPPFWTAPISVSPSPSFRLTRA